MLRTIARDGHVLGFSTDFGAMVSSGGVLEPRPIGVNRASTFTGFCARHDDQLFAAIEKEPISACEEHACLLAYRALCRELYAKEGIAGVLPHLETLDRGLPSLGQLQLQSGVAGVAKGSLTALGEIQGWKRQFDGMITSGDYSQTRYYVMWFDRTPDVLCSACKYPSWDFAGRRLQDLLDLNTPAKGISLSLVAAQDRGCAFFSWLAPADCVCVQFLQSLVSLSDDQIPHAIVRFVLSSFENQYWAPGWWEGLDEQTREALLERFRTAVHPLMPISPNSLRDDGVRSVEWQVSAHDTNVPSLERST